jgi:outer membrane protein insertion porin family
MVPADALRWSQVSTRLGLRIAVAAFVALGWSTAGAASAQYEGQVITAIQFDPEQQPLKLGQLLALIPLHTGEHMRGSDVRDAIQRLYATGEYADIAVDATLVAAGVNLKFMTKPAYFVGHVKVSGVPEPPNEGQLVVSTKLQLGTPFSGEGMKQAADHLIDVVKRNGFYNASVRPETSFQPAVQQVEINFKIDPGKRARFDGLIASGQTQRSTESIIHSTGWKHRPFGWFGWKPVTEHLLQTGVDGVRNWYPKHNRLLAKVTLANLDYHAASNTLTPELTIDSGPEVDVRIRGSKLSGGKLRSLLPIYEERTVDKDLLVEGTRDLAGYFQSQGYFDAAVTYNLALPPSGVQLIDYEVNKGIRHKIVQLEILGNHYFDTGTLRERMTVMPSSFLRYRYGRYSRGYLDRDLNAIRDLYRANGFRDVDVTSQTTDDYQSKEGQIAISIEVKEGPQWFVAKLGLQGVLAQDQAYLRSILHSTEGQPYSDLNVASDRDSILDYYYNNGYPDAKSEFTATPADEPNKMNLTFVATPGERVYVRDILVSGLERTQPDLVRRRISLKAGDPLSQNQITGSQKRLYDLGIFARVTAAIQNPEGDEPAKYVLYSLEEAGRYLMNVGFGAEIGRIGGGTTSLDSPAGTTGFSPRVSLGVSRLNFLGLGHTISLQTRVSTLEQRVLANYLAPQFEGSPKLNLQISGLLDISHDIRTFSSRREEGSIQLGQKLSRATSMQYRFTFRKVNIIGTPLIAPELIPLLSQPVRVGFPSTTFILDRRDDPLDAHRGIYTTVDFSLAAKAFGSQTGFARIIAQNATYYQLTKSLVLARSTSFGVIERFAGLPEIPLAERLFAGGSSSDRAFPDFQAGPRDPITGFPVGGTAQFFNTIEMRFPLIGDNIGGVLFNDMGNVYSSLGKMSLRFRQNGLQDFDYAVQSFGFGIRYRTPIGPFRADFSLSPNSPRFFGCQGTTSQLLYCGVANPPAGVTPVPLLTQRINVFQFHISLGQAF